MDNGYINAKAYTELINRLEDVKDAIKKQNYGIAMDILCKPYPQFQVITHSELKESEDERIRKTLLEMVHDTTGDELWVDYNVHKEDAIAWLENQGSQILANSAKTCKDEQKPAWSEEDEQYVKDTLALLAFGASVHTISQVQDWLKALKERCTWRPSDEQLKALKEAVDEHFDIDGGALWHLYEDLKKLRGK